jgi:hypothetical protein
MNNQPLAGIAALIRADPTVDTRERTRLLALLRQGGAPTTQQAATSPRRVIQRAEAAKLLGRSLRAVDAYARRGLIRRVILPGYKRALGVRADDLNTLIEASPVRIDTAQDAERTIPPS